MTENEILTRLLKTKDPNFAKSVLRGTVAGASDRAKMEAWLVVVERLGAQAARQYLPTEEMLSAYQTATGKNPLASLDESAKRALLGPLGEQYGADNARRMLGLPVQSTPPAAEPEPEPEKTEGSYADAVTGGTNFGNIFNYTYETGEGLTDPGDLPEVPGSNTGINIYESGGGSKEDPKTEGGYPDYVGGAQGNKIGDTTPIQQGGTVGIEGGHVVNGNEATLDDQAVGSSGDATKVQDPVKESAINGAATDVVDGKIEAPSGANDLGVTDGEGDGTGNGVTPDVPYVETPKPTGTPTGTPTETPTPTGTPTTGGGSGSGTPTVMPTPTVPEDDTGDEFDEKLKKNEEIANLNIREGAMTYEEWMKSAGIDTQRDFNAAAKAAAKEYDRSLGTYGATAEAMGRAGLSGSGYSDYLTGNAYAARQGSIDTARQTKTLADDAARQGYMNYLQDYEDGQRGNIAAAIGELSAMGLSGDRAKQYLSMMGIDAGYADYVVGIVDEMAAEGDPDKQALLTELLSNNLSGDAAMSYAKFLGFDEATAAEVIGMADQLTAAGKTAQADALRASVYANLLSMGLTGSDAIYYATEVAGMDPEAAKALVVQTDALLEKQAAAEAAKGEKTDPITVDIGMPVYNQLKRVYGLITNPTDAIQTGRWFGIATDAELEKLSQEEKDLINYMGPELERAVAGVPADQRTEAWEEAFVRSLYEYCKINYQFTDEQVFELLRMIGGDKLLEAVGKNGG
jgi:hypothetical protein